MITGDSGSSGALTAEGIQMLEKRDFTTGDAECGFWVGEWMGWWGLFSRGHGDILKACKPFGSRPNSTECNTTTLLVASDARL